MSQTISTVILGLLYTSGKKVSLIASLHVKCTLHIQLPHFGVASVPVKRCYSEAFCTEGKVGLL